MTSSSLTSALERVTIYREGAVCTRHVDVPAGQPNPLRIGGLPLSLEPTSLRARVVTGPSELRVLEVRPQFDVELAAEVDVPAEQHAFEEASAHVARLERQLARLDRDISELQGLQPAFAEVEPGTPPRAAAVDAVLALGDFAQSALAPRLETRRTVRRQLEDARREKQLRHQRLAEASTALRTERARLSRVAVVTLSATVDAPIVIALEYLVPGARWAPAYTLDLDGRGGASRLSLRAAVVQASGEDWAGVRLALCTGSLGRRADLPRLRALKIGRAQAAPPSSGWRDPPPGLDALFEDFDAARPAPEAPRERPPPPRPAPVPVMAERKAVAKRMREPDRAKSMSLGAPPPPVRASATAPDMARRETLGSASVEESLAMYDKAPDASVPSGEGGGGPPPAIDWTIAAAHLDYGCLVMGAATAPGRGRLAPAEAWATAFAVGVSVQVDVVVAAISRATRQADAVRALPPPRGLGPSRDDGHFDYRYDCAHPVDVPSSGRWVTVPVADCEVQLTPEYVCVPSVEPKVYRTLLVTNRGPQALPPGPVDVLRDGQFLLTTTLPAVPPGGAATHRLGLGVEEAIKVARHTSFKEATGGLLSATTLTHGVSIEVNNRLASAVGLEVRERVPTPGPDEKDVKVEETAVKPAWEVVDGPVDGEVVKGARRWRLTVPPGGQATLSAQYVIRIPAASMLVGGNRRDS